MSLNRLSYDKCSYEQVLGESVGPGFYQLTTPPNLCKPCHSTDPRIRLQSTGVSLNKNTDLVDIDSEVSAHIWSLQQNFEKWLDIHLQKS